MERIKNRKQAGIELAKQLTFYNHHSDTIVLALPRGGVPVAFEISKKLHLPLDVFLVRKLGLPEQPELAMGAIAMGGVTVFNPEILSTASISEEIIHEVVQKEQQELERRNQLYRQGQPLPKIKNKTIILVDDGLATGATMRAAVIAIKQMLPAKIIIAVPVSAKDTYQEFVKMVDEVVCLLTPEPFFSISLWYEDFPQTADEEVQLLLQQAKGYL